MIPLATVERGREGERDKAIGMAELECGVAELKSVIAADIWCGRILPAGQTLRGRREDDQHGQTQSGRRSG